jgi:hypothetical protein
VDRTFVLGSGGLYREWGYTALSRHRHEARFYVTRSDLGLDADRAPEPDPVTAGLARLLGRSQAEETASAQLRRLTDEQLETERARLAERLREIERPPDPNALEHQMEALDRRCSMQELRAEHLQAQRDATSWLRRKERRRLDAALETATSTRTQLDAQRLDLRAEVERLTGRRDTWLDRPGSDAKRYLDLDAERQDRQLLLSIADRRLNGLAAGKPRLQMPYRDTGIELDGPDLSLRHPPGSTSGGASVRLLRSSTRPP